MSSRKKVLLMGKSGSGKTSMRSIIFANFLARETEKLNPTLEVEHSDVRFLGNLVLNLWDCGGQDNFYDNYFVSQRGHIFRNVELLIYVFDIESRELEKDFRNYEECLEALEENSSDAKIFVLVHKMDKVPEESREEVFRERTELIRSRSRSFDIFPYRTSIWDETLYKAWASIVYSLIPNIGQLQTELETFCKTCGGDEAVLFERASFLVIANSTLQTHGDVHRFEKISNIIKQFKLSCSKSQTQFQGMTVSNSTFSATINAFTRSTYLMVIVSDPSLSLSAVKLNVDAVRERFEHLIAQSGNPALKDETATAAGGGGGEAVATAAE